MRILHVVHDLGSGVETAMSDYVTVTPQHEHHLFYSADPTCDIERTAKFASETCAGSGLREYARELRRVAASVRPDVVHAHSSIGGAISRTVLSRRGRAIIYTPHCFAFERRDVAWAARAAFWLAEAVLSARTTAIAACSPREAALAGRFPVHVEYVPNVAHISHPVPAAGSAPRPPLRVVCCGRVTAQKDPALLADIARSVGDAMEFEWVGGGEDQLVRELRAAGVAVTGWVSRDRAVERLARADVYVHTARWESAPMSVLEAAAMGVPVLARDTPALRALGCDPVWSTAEQLRAMLTDSRVLARARGTAAQITARHTVTAQCAALDRVYGVRGRTQAEPALRDAV